jgi:predicted  nucleic acid-binding Zn-ribbon protein
MPRTSKALLTSLHRPGQDRPLERVLADNEAKIQTFPFYGAATNSSMAIPAGLPDSDVAKCLEFIGASRKILLIGETRQELLGALGEHGCQVQCLGLSPNGRGSVAVLPDGLREHGFEAIVLDRALERLGDPAELLFTAREALADRGFILAVLPNRTYGVRRLIRLRDRPSNGERPELLGFRLEQARELFSANGYRVEAIDAIRRPIFGSANGLPGVSRAEFPPAVVDEVESDPNADVYEFVVKAVPSAAAIPAAPTEVETFPSALEERLAALAARRTAQAAELLALRTQLREVEERAASAEATALRLAADVSERDSALEAFARERAALNDELDETRRQATALTTDLSKLFDRLGEQQRQYDDLHRYSDRTIGELRGQLASLQERDRSVTAQNQELRDREAAMREQLREADRQAFEQSCEVTRLTHELTDRAEELVAKMQAESAEIAELVDTVQSSRFWQFKRWFGRFRARSLGL